MIVFDLGAGLSGSTASRAGAVSAGGITYLFQDTFTGSIGSGWTETDSANHLFVSNNRLFSDAGVAWNDPALWRTSTIARTSLGAFSVIYFPRGAAQVGPAVVIASATNPANSNASTIHGVTGDTRDWKTIGTNGGAVITKSTARLRSIDHVVIVVVRPTQGYLVLVSGGVYGEYPNGEILWVDPNGTEANLYCGLVYTSGINRIDTAQGVARTDLPAAWQTDYGLSEAYDDFGRANSTNLGSTPGGGFAWSEPEGDMQILSNQLARNGTNVSSAAFTCTNQPYRIQASIRSPSSGAQYALLVVRRDSSNGRIEIGLDSTGGNIFVYDSVGASTLHSQAYTYTNSTDYVITVVDATTGLYVWLNGTALNSGALISSTQNNTQKGVGYRMHDSANDNGSVCKWIAVWPRTVTISSAFQPTAVVTGGSSIFTDAFTDTNGVRLNTHNASWTEHTGTWEINTNKARLSTSGAAGRATYPAGQANHEVSADIALPAAPGSNDWNCGLIARYVDANNYFYARFIWQSASPEIEVWQVIGGSETFVDMVNLTDVLSASSTYTLKLACLSRRCDIYFAGERVLTVDIDSALDSATRCGLIVQPSPASGQPTWDNFAIKST